LFSKEKTDVFCIGKTNLDIFYYIDKIKIEENHVANNFAYFPGGKATNVAINLANLGLKVTLISAIANDIFGRYIKEKLENILIFKPQIVKNENTALTSIVVEGSGANTMFHNLGANQFLSPQAIPDNMNFAFIQTGIPQETLFKSLQSSKAAFVELSETSQFEILKNFSVEYVSLNKDELIKIFKDENIEKNLAKLSHFAKHIVLKMGKEGIIYAGDTIIRKKAKSVKVVNTTGAGDAVSAAFIYGTINDWEIEKTLDFCIEFASKIIQSIYST
jgi:sugar/nucleoside kinase (ribokinase family)